MSKPEKPLSPKQQELLRLLREGWDVMPSEYHGRFGTMAASCWRYNSVGQYESVKITQATIDALYKRGLCRYVGGLRDKRVKPVPTPSPEITS